MPTNGGGEGESGIAHIAVASAGDPRSAVESALALLGDRIPALDGAILLLPPPPAPRGLREAAQIVTGQRAPIARPRSGIGDLVSGDVNWRELPVPAGAQRFDRVRVPAHLLDRGRVLALSLPTDRGSLTPLSLLAQFAHPRQRLAARFGGDPGATAELVAPLRPDLVLLAGRSGNQGIAVVTPDFIAAELVAQALLAEDPHDDEPGPWERPVVQRATDLDLGVRMPSGIRFLTACDAAESFVAPIRPRLGVT